MKVLAVSPLASVAGAEVMLLRLVPELRSRHWDLEATVPGKGELEERLRMDGVRVVRLPLGLPAIASLAIFQFLWTWNDLLVALVFGGDTKPITVAIFTQLRSFSANIDIIGPAAFISLAIPLAVFFAFQRYFVQGLLAGSVK